MFLSGWEIFYFIETSGMIDFVDYKNCVRNSGIFSGVVFFFIPNWQEAGIEYWDSKEFICIIQILPKTVLHRGLINLLELITNEHEELYMGICEWKSFCWIWYILRTFWFWKKYHPKRVGMNWWFELHCL